MCPWKNQLFKMVSRISPELGPKHMFNQCQRHPPVHWLSHGLNHKEAGEPPAGTHLRTPRSWGYHAVTSDRSHQQGPREEPVLSLP